MKAVLETKKLRKMKFISINQLSYKSGVAKGYIREMEDCKYDNPSLNVICKLCLALKVTPNDLIINELWKGEKQ